MVRVGQTSTPAGKWLWVRSLGRGDDPTAAPDSTDLPGLLILTEFLRDIIGAECTAVNRKPPLKANRINSFDANARPNDA